MPSRQLRRSERAAAYGLLGMGGEVVFTALQRAARRSTRTAQLEGHTYLWMAPIYGLCAVLFEPVHDRLRGQAPARRAVAYAAGILAVEYVSGRLIAGLTGAVPWDYTGRSRFQLHGATRFDYAPLWAVAGLGLERVDDTLRSVRLAPAG